MLLEMSNVLYIIAAAILGFLIKVTWDILKSSTMNNEKNIMDITKDLYKTEAKLDKVIKDLKVAHSRIRFLSSTIKTSVDHIQE